MTGEKNHCPVFQRIFSSMSTSVRQSALFISDLECSGPVKRFVRLMQSLSQLDPAAQQAPLSDQLSGLDLGLSTYLLSSLYCTVKRARAYTDSEVLLFTELCRIRSRIIYYDHNFLVNVFFQAFPCLVHFPLLLSSTACGWMDALTTAFHLQTDQKMGWKWASQEWQYLEMWLGPCMQSIIYRFSLSNEGSDLSLFQMWKHWYCPLVHGSWYQCRPLSPHRPLEF